MKFPYKIMFYYTNIEEEKYSVAGETKDSRERVTPERKATENRLRTDMS